MLFFGCTLIKSVQDQLIINLQEIFLIKMKVEWKKKTIIEGKFKYTT